MKTLWLLLKNLLFTVIVLGFLVGWVPLNWFERHARWPEQWGPLQWLGLLVGLLGAATYLACQWLFFAKGQGTPAHFDPPRRFVRRGLYKWVRNPMYLAIIALVAAQALYFQSWHISVYLVCLVCLAHVFVVMYEENALRYRFGAMYEDYKREVPRWLPRKPRPPLQTVAPFEVKR